MMPPHLLTLLSSLQMILLEMYNVNCVLVSVLVYSSIVFKIYNIICCWYEIIINQCTEEASS